MNENRIVNQGIHRLWFNEGVAWCTCGRWRLADVPQNVAVAAFSNHSANGRGDGA